jgi:putative membrane protein
MKSLVVEERWIMYSLFIGLTLGGVPLVWRLARPATPALWLGAAASFALMVVMSLGGSARAGEDANLALLTLSGLAGASAMILPGVSGGYLLLLLGQYEPILGAIDTLKIGLLGGDAGGFDLSLVLQAMQVVLPVGIGVAIGVIGVSNLLRWLLDHYEKPTLGILLGLLLGSVVGLYPFQEPVAPDPGYAHRGKLLTAQEVASLDERYWPLERFTPGAGHAGGALALILAGLGGTLLVDRIGSDDDEADVPAHG